MKQLLLGVLGLAGAATLAACHQAAPATATAPPAAPAAATDSTAAVLALLQRVDLAPAWGNRTPDTREYGALEGFYGATHYRMSFYFDEVRRDLRQPNVFHFRGRDRYKRVVTPFTGTLTVTRLAPLADTVGYTAQLPRATPFYTAFASFVLREDSTHKGAGRCRGRAVLDFYLGPQQRPEQIPTGYGEVGHDTPSRGGGLLFTGTWQDNRTGRRQPVQWGNFYWLFTPQALRDLNLTQRAQEVDERLAPYGWNTIAENDEWWATSPTPKLSL